MDLLFIDFMKHFSHVTQMLSQALHLSSKLILSFGIARTRVDLERFCGEESFLVESFEPATFRPRSSFAAGLCMLSLNEKAKEVLVAMRSNTSPKTLRTLP